MVDNTNKLNTQYNFAIPTTQEEREKIILLAVKMLTEKEGGNITLNQLLSYVDNNLNNLSNEVAQALINKSNNGHNHDDRYYTEDEVNTKVSQLKSDLVAKNSMLSYEEIMASTPPIDLDIGIPKANAIKEIGGRILTGHNYFEAISELGEQNVTISYGIELPNKPKAILLTWEDNYLTSEYCQGLNVRSHSSISTTQFVVTTKRLKAGSEWYFNWVVIY